MMCNGLAAALGLQRLGHYDVTRTASRVATTTASSMPITSPRSYSAAALEHLDRQSDDLSCVSDV
jgi:hypothetical protein